MNPLASNQQSQQSQINPPEEQQVNPTAQEQLMINGYTNYIYGAVGPFPSDQLFIDNQGVVILPSDRYDNLGTLSAICEDAFGNRWMIVTNTDTYWRALGPFDLNQLVLQDDVVTGIRLGDKVESTGLGSQLICFDGSGSCWIVFSMPTDSSDGQSFHVPAIPPAAHLPEVEGELFQASGPDTIDQPSAESHPQAMQPAIYSGALMEDGADHQTLPIVPTSHESAAAEMEIIDVCGGEFQGLMPPVDVNGLETAPQGDHAVLEHETPSGAGEFQSVGPSESDGDMSFEDFYALLEREIDEEPPTGPPSVDCVADVADSAAPIVPSSHGAAPTWMEISGHGDEGLGPGMNVNSNETRQGQDAVLVEQPGGSLSLGASQQCVSSTGSSSEEASPRKRARITHELSPSSVLEDVRRRANCQAPILTSREVAVPEIMVTEGHDNQGLAPPVHGNFVQTQATDSGECLSEYSSRRTAGEMAGEPGEEPAGEVVGEMAVEMEVEVEGEMAGEMAGEMEVQMEGEMAGWTVATTSVNPIESQPTRRRPPAQPKFKNHGAMKRAGCVTSFVAYFRPKDLPQSDKTFLTLGEFTNERDAWEAFNLFALVHEGEDACINADIDSISSEAEFWGDYPRVDLVAHLRLKGREYFTNYGRGLDVLPPDCKVPHYRNVKFRKNSQGPHAGQIRWFSDVSLSKEVVDPNVVNGSKDSTYDTAEEAAKEADRLMMLKEGFMAWTNYSVTTYMTDSQKEQWDKTWIPLQDNPRKYLSTVKHGKRGRPGEISSQGDEPLT